MNNRINAINTIEGQTDKSQVTAETIDGKRYLHVSLPGGGVNITISITPRGEYDNATTYNVGDLVTRNGTSYVAIADSTGNPPPNATFWQVLGSESSFVINVRNETGATLTKGQAVYINGATGSRPTVALADNSNDVTSDQTIGLIAEDISNNSEGLLLIEGFLNDIDTSGFTEGDSLYLGASGGLTNVKPISPLHEIFIGYVIASSPTNGQIFVKINNFGHIEDLHDVLITAPTDRDLLVFESASGLYKNGKITTSDLSDFATAVPSVETDPVFGASEAANFVAGDKTNLDNQSGINTGDETTLSIQTKRPLKTVGGQSLEGVGNVDITGGKFVDGTDPLDAVYIDGNVGIGTENPQGLLHIVNPNNTNTQVFLENTATSGFLGDAGFRVKTRNSDFQFLGNDDFKGFVILDSTAFYFPMITNPSDCMSIYPVDFSEAFVQSQYKLDVGGLVRVRDLKIQTSAPTSQGKIWTATDSEGNGEWGPRSTYSDYSKTVTSTLPTTFTKLDMSGATLVGETEPLFDAVNSRIVGFNLGETGIVSVSMAIDSSSATNHWVEVQLRGYDSGGVELFQKRGSVRPLAKGVVDENLHKNLEFYFGPNVSYFEIYIQADSALTYTDPSINVIKL